jgi:hypothetical protein
MPIVLCDLNASELRQAMEYGLGVAERGQYDAS